jgi:hypothetical protein
MSGNNFGSSGLLLCVIGLQSYSSLDADYASNA